MSASIFAAVRNPYLLGYVGIYASILVLLSRAPSFDLSEPLFVLVVVGGGFSLLAWWVTKRTTPVSLTVLAPGTESTVLLMYLFIIAAYLGWGVTLLDSIVPADPLKSVATLSVKIMLFVAVPYLLLRKVSGYRPGELTGNASQIRMFIAPTVLMSAVVILFQIVAGQGFSAIRSLPVWESGIGVPLAFAWLVLEVGIVEELFFRALLQERVAALFQSEVAGVVIASLLFGLVHAPGLYLRTARTGELPGTPPTMFAAIGYSIVVTSVAGFFLGILWSRTRSLFVVVCVHAANDLIPGVVPFLKAWHF